MAANILEMVFDHPIIDLQILKKLIVVSILQSLPSCLVNIDSSASQSRLPACIRREAATCHCFASTGLLLVQISSLSRKLAMAVPLLLERKGSCELWPKPGCQMPCLSSPLMLRWAPHIKHAFLPVQCTEYMGIRVFMAAASCLTEAYISYPEHYTCNGSLIHSTSSSLYCCEAPGRDMQGQLWEAGDPPSQRPQDQELTLHLSTSEQLERWLLTLSCVPRLRRLIINADNLTELQSTVELPSLAEVHVYMIASAYSPMRLRWLRLQSSSMISMHIRLSQHTARQARQAVSELQTLRIRVLHLQTSYSSFPAEVQHIWGQLTCCEQLHIAFEGHQGAVHALPTCELALVSGPVASSMQPIQRSFFLCWSAVHCPGRLLISLDHSQSVRVKGYAELPASCARPWQMVIRSAAGVKGLPPSRATDEGYFLQNAAADAAGWQSLASRKLCTVCPCVYTDPAPGTAYGAYGTRVPC